MTGIQAVPRAAAHGERVPQSGGQPEQERPLGGYGLVLGTFVSLGGAFALWFERSGRELPDRMAPGDLALLTVATHKLARLVAKDRVTSVLRAPFASPAGDDGPGEVRDEPRGHGLQLVIGDLLTCPYCIGMWIGSGFAAGLIVAPRATRWVASVLAILTGSDVLQMAYRRLEDTL